MMTGSRGGEETGKALDLPMPAARVAAGRFCGSYIQRGYVVHGVQGIVGPIHGGAEVLSPVLRAASACGATLFNQALLVAVLRRLYFSSNRAHRMLAEQMNGPQTCMLAVYRGPRILLWYCYQEPSSGFRCPQGRNIE